MEQSCSYTPEKIDPSVHFYAEWLKDVLQGNIINAQELQDVSRKLSGLLGPDTHEIARSYDIDLSAIRNVHLDVEDRIEDAIDKTATDLQENIFDGGLFDVEIHSENRILVVESLVVIGRRILPVVEAKPYFGSRDCIKMSIPGKIDDILLQ